MRIEEEIKSRGFASEFQKMFVNIQFTSLWIDRLISEFLKPFGISHPQFNVLKILRGQYPNPASVKLVIERMLVPTSNASRLVETLKNKELVERTENPDDRRFVDVCINDTGLELLKSVDVAFVDFEKKFKNVMLEEAETLNTILDKLRK